jgi:hypothetical protein
MLGDLYAADAERALDHLAALPPEPKRPEPRSAWGELLRGPAAGGAELLADFTKLRAGVEQTIAERLALQPIPDESIRQRGRQALRETAAAAQAYAESLRPDPNTASTAEQLVFGLARGLPKAIGAVVALGPVGGAAAFGASEGSQEYQRLRAEGVDEATATLAGSVAGVVGGGSILLPMVGPTVGATVGLYLAGGPGGFVAQQAATRAILEGADYGDIARQYDPLDPLGLTLSAAVPLPFAAAGVVRNLRAGRAAGGPTGGEAAARAAQPQAANAVPREAPPAPVATQEAVDAAMVHNLTTRADALTQIPPQEGLTPLERVVEDQFRAQVLADPEATLRAYAALPDTAGGKIVNTDEARELFAPYSASNAARATLARAVHEPASWVARLQWERLLAAPPKTGEVLILGGGGGSGKTSSLEYVSPGFRDRYDAIYDMTLANAAKSEAVIRQALESGRRVTVSFTVRDPFDALVNGVIPRAAAKGRTVPLDVAARAHEDAPRSFMQMLERFADDDRVRFEVIDNTRGPGQQRKMSAADLPQFDYNDLVGRAVRAARAAYEKGAIDATVLRGLVGEGQGEGGARLRAVAQRSGDGRTGAEPAPGVAGIREDPAGAAGAAAEVVTERGLTVAIRYRLVDAGDLVTSHTDDLTPNPAFPQELQPRDRQRADSAAQIARIENRIRPELLGESVKASDGAPIVGGDLIVESGNARTIALRRAYDSGKAEDYRAWLAANARRFGLLEDDVRAMRRPVLVRERIGEVDRAEFARQANESAVAAMSASEQARADARRMRDLADLVTNDDGTINTRASAPFVSRFLRDVAPTERGRLLQADGTLSQEGQTRLRNAVFARAYGDSDLVAMLAESTDSNVRNILNGLLRAAPEVARLRDLIDAGARQPIDVSAAMSRAAREFARLREQGMTVQQMIDQGSLFGDALPPEITNLMIGLSENARAPRRIAELLRQMVRAVDELGDPRQAGMFDDGQPASAVDTTADAVERLRAISDAQLADVEQSPASTGTDALMRSVAERLREVETTAPDMAIALDADGRPITVAEELARVRREAAQGTDTELGALDADLLRVAADCALAAGAA